MSVGAYRIETKTIKGRIWSSPVSRPTFNCWNDFKLTLFLRDHEDTVDQTNIDGCGIICVSKIAIEESINNQKELEYSDNVLESLKADLKVLEEGGEEYLDYNCF